MCVYMCLYCSTSYVPRAFPAGGTSISEIFGPPADRAFLRGQRKFRNSALVWRSRPLIRHLKWRIKGRLRQTIDNITILSMARLTVPSVTGEDVFCDDQCGERCYVIWVSSFNRPIRPFPRANHSDTSRLSLETIIYFLTFTLSLEGTGPIESPLPSTRPRHRFTFF